MNTRQMERFNYMSREFDRLMHENTVLKHEVEIMRERLNVLEARKPGRPKKDAQTH